MDYVLKLLSQINDFIRHVNSFKILILQTCRSRKNGGFVTSQKALVIRVFLYSESARTYDRKSDDLEICRV